MIDNCRRRRGLLARTDLLVPGESEPSDEALLEEGNNGEDVFASEDDVEVEPAEFDAELSELEALDGVEAWDEFVGAKADRPSNSLSPICPFGNRFRRETLPITELLARVNIARQVSQLDRGSVRPAIADCLRSELRGVERNPAVSEVR